MFRSPFTQQVVEVLQTTGTLLLRGLAAPGSGWVRSLLAGGLGGLALGALAQRWADTDAPVPVPELREPAPVDVVDAWPLLLEQALRRDVAEALGRMSDQQLTLAFLDIQHNFNDSLERGYLGAARNLVDYAFLAERELALRRLARPSGTYSAADLLRRFELML